MKTIEDLDFEDLLNHINPGIYPTDFFNHYSIRFAVYHPLPISRGGLYQTSYTGAGGTEYQNADDAVLSYGKTKYIYNVTFENIIMAYCRKYGYQIVANDIMNLLKDLKFIKKCSVGVLVYEPI